MTGHVEAELRPKLSRKPSAMVYGTPGLVRQTIADGLRDSFGLSSGRPIVSPLVSPTIENQMDEVVHVSQMELTARMSALGYCSMSVTIGDRCSSLSHTQHSTANAPLHMSAMYAYLGTKKRRMLLWMPASACLDVCSGCCTGVGLARFCAGADSPPCAGTACSACAAS